MNNDIAPKPPTSPDAPPGKRPIWKRRLIVVPIVVLLLLLTTAFAVVWYANSQARQKLTQQLSALNQGDTKIGDISIGMGGIKAKDVVMFRPGSDTPWLTVDELNVDAPLSELVSSDPKFDRIEIKRPQVVLELADDGSLPELIKEGPSTGLPADNIVISNASIEIRQLNHDNLIATGVDVSLKKDNDTIQIEGTAGQLLDSAWTLKGSYQEANQLLKLSAETDTLNIDSKSIATMPMVPKGVLNSVDFSGTAIAEVRIKAGGDGPFEYHSSIVPTDMKFASEMVGINMQIVGGSAELNNGVITVTKLDGKLGDGTVIANSSIDLNSSPIKGDFDAVVSNVSVDEIRKLARIPENVEGVLSGNGSGSMIINGESGFELRLNADGSVANAVYDEISAEDTTVSVEINPLAFDRQLKFITLIGEVTVNSTANQIAVQRMMESFDIEPGNSNQQIDGRADATVKLSIPLQTADDIGSWKLDVVAAANRLAVQDRFLDNVAAKVGISDGFLNFEQFTGNATSQQQSSVTNAGKVSATGRWPLAQERNAKFEIDGKDVSIEWLLDIAKDYSEDVDAVLKMIDPKYDGENSSVAGKLSVTATIEVAPDQMQDISKWSVTGVVSSGNITIDKRSINSIESRFELINGVFILESFKGSVPDGGTIELKASYPIDPKQEAAIDLSATSFPVEWLISLGTDLNKDFSATLEQLRLKPDGDTEQLAGLINLDVKLKRAAAGADLVDDVDAGQRWDLASTVTSPSLRVRSSELRDLLAKVKVNPTEVLIEKLEVSDPFDGKLTANGRWPLDGGGEAVLDAKWMKLPLQMLSDIAGVTGINLSGTTSGELHLEKSTGEVADDSGLIVRGQLDVDNLKVGDASLEKISAKISTDEKIIRLSQIQYGQTNLDAQLKATISSMSPYEFHVDANIEDLDLGPIAKSELAREATGIELVEISGKAGINAALAGTLEPFDFATNGNAQVRDLVVDRLSLDDISARWKNVGADLSRSEAKIDAFGGSISLREITTAPNHLMVDIQDIDAEQLSSILGDQLKLTGRLSGDATVDAWEELELVRAQLSIAGASADLGPVALESLGGEAKYAGGKLDYEIRGIMLDGEFSAVGNVALPEEGRNEPMLNTELKLIGADLNRLSRSSRSFSDMRDLSGYVDANFDLKMTGPEYTPEGLGKVSLRDMKFRGEPLVSRGSASLQLLDMAVVVSDLKADLAGGEVSGQASYPLDGKQAGRYQIAVRRVSLSRLGPLTRDRDLDAEGYLDARIGGSIGQELTGSGQIAVQRLSVYDIPSQSIRLPIQYRVNLASMSGKLELLRSRVRIFDGTTTAKATIEFGPRLNLTFSADMTNLDSGKIIGAFTGDRTYDQGELSGKLNLKGRGIRSVRDLQGSFVGSLDRTKSFNLPVLDDLSLFLNTNRLTQSTFDSDDIRLQLANGQVSIQRLTFAGDAAQIMVTGSVSTDQRLNLDVIGRIGNLNVNPFLERLVDSPLTKVGVPSLALLSGITEFLSNRVVYVHVGGTVRSPAFRLQTGLILRDEALQFFVRGTELENIMNNRQNR